MAERQGFQKFLEIQVIPRINPNLNLLSLAFLLEHLLALSPWEKNNGGINHRTLYQLDSVLGHAALNIATGSRQGCVSWGAVSLGDQGSDSFRDEPGTPKASRFDLCTSQTRFFLFLKVNLECLVDLMDLV